MVGGAEAAAAAGRGRGKREVSGDAHFATRARAREAAAGKGRSLESREETKKRRLSALSLQDAGGGFRFFCGERGRARADAYVGQRWANTNGGLEETTGHRGTLQWARVGVTAARQGHEPLGVGGRGGGRGEGAGKGRKQSGRALNHWREMKSGRERRGHCWGAGGWLEGGDDGGKTTGQGGATGQKRRQKEGGGRGGRGEGPLFRSRQDRPRGAAARGCRRRLAPPAASKFLRFAFLCKPGRGLFRGWRGAEKVPGRPCVTGNFHP